VRARHGDRVAAPFLRRQKCFSGTLEPEDVHTRYSGIGKLFAKLRRNGSEVFADDDGAVPMGFKCDEPEQVIDRVAQIRALTRLRAVRHQPQPRQTHHVIDPDTAGVPERRAQRREERFEAARNERARRKSRKAPVLSARIEQVGRCADIQARQQVFLT
jgi:hypothetical protein